MASNHHFFIIKFLRKSITTLYKTWRNSNCICRIKAAKENFCGQVYSKVANGRLQAFGISVNYILITSLPTGFYLLKSPKNTLLMGFFSFTMGQRLSILFQLTLSSTWNTSFFGKTGVGVSYPRRKK